ncbi:OmpA family protein [Tropicimonas sp. S265A]|uniref:OmpA family protein n=1 Tax=Tropicimonas sp. S265A TaxID=3415134 RepID=UPI003C79F608
MSVFRLFKISVLPVFLAVFGAAPLAAANPFEPGWILESEGSALRFTSVKKGSVVETSTFATYTGLIDPNGAAEIKVLLDSVDTGIDLRNVRMRFLFFETFKFPEATIRLQLDPALIEDLQTVRRKIVTLPYQMTIKGVTVDKEADVAVTLLSDDLVSVTSSAPITITLEDFKLNEGREKLEEAAGVTIVPSASVTFDFLFSRLPTVPDATTTVSSRAAVPEPIQVALETSGNFSREECAGRFEILSRTGNIYFASGSARLRSESVAVLDSIADIISRCPGLVVEISGHTDSDGSEAANRALSERRAQSVLSYFTNKDVPAERMVSVGYGEAEPIFPNTTAENKQRNRRIEFQLIK